MEIFKFLNKRRNFSFYLNLKNNLKNTFLLQLKFEQIVTFLVLLCAIFMFSRVFSQCGTFINTFPYTEDFEANPQWTSGGTSSDWAWGTPAHALINTAGGGNKSWCIGNLSGSTYNDSELSFLMSPCFDFTNLDYPWISFKLFWENEYKWDGSVFQYSLNGGTSWSNVGSFGDPVDCRNDNWYNYASIFWLSSASPKHGWTGRIDPTSGSCQGGNGSEEWLTAKHCMSQLAGEANVRFGFLFGSGNTCNDYDGFAIDDILIENTSPLNSSFTYICATSNDVSFTNTSTNCSTNYLWNFGDPNSGSSNTSNSNNPLHTFSAPGTYTVSLTSTSSCNQAGISTQTIKILPNTTNSTNIGCFGENTGSVSVAGSITSSYSWNTNPVQTTQTISNLVAGNYVVSISESNACPNSAIVTITEPPQLNLTLTNLASCSNTCDGSLSMLATGGTAPYTYTWSNFGNGQSFNGVICPNSYTGTVTDAKTCVKSGTTTVHINQKPIVLCDSANICIGSKTILTASGANSYVWSPNIFLSSTTNSSTVASPVSSTKYTVIGTSLDGCKDTVDVMVTVSDIFAPSADFSFSPSASDVYNTELFFSNESSGGDNFTWTFDKLDSSHLTNPIFTFPNDKAASYFVCLKVGNDILCTEEICKTIKITGIPSVFIPNSFSPDKNGINDFFFPVIKDISNENYSFTIYNRWGEEIFFSTDMNEKWNGIYKNHTCQNGIYSWKLTFKDEENKEVKVETGFVNLSR